MDNPNWGELHDDISCPMCEYNLRGLTDPRCPECGFRFQWAELLDPIRRSHSYLFEHHPERNLWSFWKTLLGGLQPTVFWQSLHPAQPSRPRRIAVYAVITMLPLLITCAIHIGVGGAFESAWRYGSGIKIRMLRQLALYLGSFVREDAFAQLMLACVVWPWLTLLALSVFRWSLLQANVRSVHVVRSIVYSADVWLLIWPCFAISTVTFWIDFAAWGGFKWANAAFQRRESIFDGAWPYFVLIMLTTFSYRLVQAYRCYMRFDHVVATVLCAQAMVLLAVLKLVFMMRGM